MSIHKTAIVSPKSNIDKSADIGPNVIIEPGVTIGKDVIIMANSYISGGTEIGDGTQVHIGAVIGHDPQDYNYKGGKTFTRIGKNNIIREYVTIHRGTSEGTSTVIGNNNFILAHSHVAHNCHIDDNVVIANGALLAGYVEVGKGVFISGNVVFHQYCRIGCYAMIGGFSGVNQDVPPYTIIRGPSVVRGVNLIGLRRSGIKKESINEIKKAYALLYTSGLSQGKAIEEIKNTLKSEEIKIFTSFIEGSKRGICKQKFSKEEYFD